MFITIGMFLFTVTITSGQHIAAPSLTHAEARNFLQLLNTRTADTTRIDILLQLATYHILKDGKNKANLDSAAAFIQQANDLNTKIRSPRLEGYITLVESSLAKKSGDTITGKKLVNKSIRLLESANGPFHRAMAYLELLSYIDFKHPDQLAEVNSLIPAVFLQLHKIKNPTERTDCIFAITHFYQTILNELDREKKLSFLNDFLSACRAIKDGAGEVWVRKEIADIHYQQGKAKEAENELLELLKFQQAGRYPHICFTYDLLTGVYVHTSNYRNAMYYALETIKSVSAPLDSSYLPDFYSRIVDIYNYWENSEQAYYWGMKIIDALILTGKTSWFYTASANIVFHLIRMNKAEEALDFILDKKKNYPPTDVDQEQALATALARCYQALNNNLLAEKYCLEIIRLYNSQISRGERPYDITPIHFVAYFYLHTRQYSKAQKYLRTVLHEWPTSGRVARDLLESRFMHEIDAASGNYFLAYKHLMRYQYLNDSVFDATKSKQIEELRISYDTEKKDDSIKLKDKDISLLKQQNDLQKANLKQAAFVKKVTIAGIILAFVIIVLLYRQYRLKQKSNHSITHKNELLQHFLTEKEWLLKEIHHRVKNNLQIVMSLLNSQSAYIDNEAALTAIHDSQHRVHAMSLIHQKLYNTENVSSIDMSSYIRELVSYLSDSFNTGQRIHFEYNIEPLELDVSQAVPLGLILNEAITNSLKYAFPDDKKGVITISLSNTSLNNYLLTISDNGIGMPVQVKDKKPGSLGMSLMAGLSEDLDGSFSIENNNGTVIRIVFVHDMSVKRPESLISSFVTSNQDK
jgi:two-component sensor histidine kinase